jgi:hypothetical protein
MTMWRLDRLDIGPPNASVPTSRDCKITLRDGDTGEVFVTGGAIPYATLADSALLLTRFCLLFDGLYTPNDFGCPP